MSKVILRNLYESDVKHLLKWENDQSISQFSGHKNPVSYTEEDIQNLIKNNPKIYENKQFRLMVCLDSLENAIGAVDLFEMDFENKTTKIGILIAEEKNRNMGFAKEAILMMEDFAKDNFEIHCVFADVQAENLKSLNLFKGLNYEIFNNINSRKSNTPYIYNLKKDLNLK